ncbi:MAG: diguanylate cyclase, partial [Magnetococcales bacterium]|nr:diguanylate cyclase [Magnetococcales bacterium]
LKEVPKRSVDLVARYGGEEFAAVLPHTDQDAAKILAEKMRQAVADLRIKHAHSTVADHISLSLGVATTVPTLESIPQSLIEAADRHLYEAKRTGRNCVISNQVTL